MKRLFRLIVPLLLFISAAVAIQFGLFAESLCNKHPGSDARWLRVADPAPSEPDDEYLFNPDKVRQPITPSSAPVFVFSAYHGGRGDARWPGALVLYADGAVLYRPQAPGESPPEIRVLQLSIGDSARLFNDLGREVRPLNNGMHFPPDSRYTVFQWRDENGTIVAESGWRLGDEPRALMDLVQSLGARCEQSGNEVQSPGDRFFPVNHPVTAPHPTTPNPALHALDPRAVRLPVEEFEQPVFAFERHPKSDAENCWPEALVVYADSVVHYRPAGTDQVPPSIRAVQLPPVPARDLMRIVQGCLNDLPDDQYVDPAFEYAVIRWFGNSGSIVAETVYPGLRSDRVVLGVLNSRDEAWADIFRQVRFAATRCLNADEEIESLRGRYFPVEHPFK